MIKDKPQEQLEADEILKEMVEERKRKEAEKVGGNKKADL
jgi:hypothetical protein